MFVLAAMLSHIHMAGFIRSILLIPAGIAGGITAVTGIQQRDEASAEDLPALDGAIIGGVGGLFCQRHDQ